MNAAEENQQEARASIESDLEGGALCVRPPLQNVTIEPLPLRFRRVTVSSLDLQ